MDLCIDNRPCIVYTEARGRHKNTTNHDEDGQERGLIPMASVETPPNAQLKIDAEGNESKDLVN